MGKTSGYISVILPLKLAWEPFYALPEGVEAEVGNRVRVAFAGRLYLGVVSAVNVVPDDRAMSRIREIKEIVHERCNVAPSEIEFWRKLADYYMCSIGEVFKAAYTLAKDKDVKTRSGKQESCGKEVETGQATLAEIGERNRGIYAALEEKVCKGRRIFLKAADQEILLEALCQRLPERNILWLVPEKKFEKAVLDRLKTALGGRLVIWDSDLTPAGKRRVAERVRSGGPYVVFGTRSALFLPHRNLGLVIVRDEHESSYKQTSPAPRYNGRDAALILASIFNASCVLTSSTPSLETVYNGITGKYDVLRDGQGRNPEFVMIDTKAELRKNGMTGGISRKLIEAATVPFAAYKPRRAVFPKMEDLESHLRNAFGKDVFITDDMIVNAVPENISMLAVFGVDAMLGRQDFRADERAYQTISNAVSLCPETLKTVVIQTREPDHSVFAAIKSGDTGPLLDERRAFSLPPYTRLMDIVVTDADERREKDVCERLQKAIEHYAPSVRAKGMLRVTLPRDKKMAEVKQAIKATVEAMERDEKYAGHIYFDVDPIL